MRGLRNASIKISIKSNTYVITLAAALILGADITRSGNPAR
jgi:hypothetical protein